jgi:ribonuclease J
MKIHTVGGYSEVGKNMTVVELKDDAFVLDCGFFLPAIVELEEREKIYTENRLRGIGAIPDDNVIPEELRNKVRAIIPSHAHLDHIGAIPYLGQRYNAPVLGTPFTIEVLKTLYMDEEIPIRNKLIPIQPNQSYIIQGKNREYQIDFINMTHSTIQTSMIAIHTEEGVFLYSNDFKFDNNPILGLKPNYDALKAIAKEGVKALVVDALYAPDNRKTASEKVARTLLEDVMLTTTNDKAGMIVTTFSSHIARLKSIVDFGKKLNREIVFVGRSLNKYTSAARNVGQCPFAKDIRIVSYRRQVEKALKRANKNRSKYLLVTTGHQGEPFSVLDRMARNHLPFELQSQDHVIFSSSVIPTEVTMQNREQLDKRLKKRGVRIFNNIHVSGHAGREDLRDFLNMVNAEHILPAHGDHRQSEALMELGKELGYKRNKTAHHLEDGQTLQI